MTTRRKKKSGTVPEEENVPETTAPAELPAAAPATETPALEAGSELPPPPRRPVPYAEPGIAWGNVIRDVLRIDNPAGLAKRLRAELVMSDEERSSYGSLLAALDKSAKNYDDAYILFRAAKVEEARFGLETRERFEVMKEHASAELMAEYKDKKRRSPTNDDIEDRMLANWPDEYRHLKTKEAELHAAMRTLETLAKAWSSRCADLRAMADMFTNRRKG